MSPGYASRTVGPSRSLWEEVELTIFSLSRTQPLGSDPTPCYNRVPRAYAGVAELVDAPDSKSGGARAPCRFEPDLRYSLRFCRPLLHQFHHQRPRKAHSIGLAVLSCMGRG